VINGRNEERLESAVEKLKNRYPDVVGLAGDVCDESTHKKLIELCQSTYGKVDYYINNAGIPQENLNFNELEVEDIKRLCNINIVGAMMGTHAAYNAMKKQGHGKIFNVEGFGSTGSMRNKISLYGASKRLIQYFTKSISRELSNKDIQIGIISPGMVRTDFLEVGWKHNSEKEKKQFEKVYRILGEDVDVVTTFLAEKLLKSSKQYDRIEFLKGFTLTKKIVQLIFAK
jgi:short-subunit dehydrogenase